MATKVAAHYISEKVSKVRWLPEKLQQSERFVTGSWDMDNNFVRVWRLHSNTYAQNIDHIPRCTDKVSMEGDVTGLEFVSNDTLAVSCADGHLSILNVQRAVEEDQIERTARSDRLHEFKCSNTSAPCTAIAVYGTDVATVGEDGCVNVLNANNLKQVKRTIDADSMSLLAVSYVSQHQLVTANRMGVIRMFDTRISSEGQPKIAFMAACQDAKSSNYVSAMATHPMQQHILICGSEEGSITVWDMRNLEFPASYLSAHSSPITDIGFHRQDPSKLFTAAEAGEVWMWSENKTHIDPAQQDGKNAWLSGDRVRALVNVDGVLTNIRKAVNSFDVHGSRLVCGSDTEAVYIVDDIL
ncbi:nucleoporin Nup43 [Drosophila innubila]|uniref:nucleoporin Nup43 n=1 Tax=Drosophila innubila TaxID=198719 RepID=UPI00148E3368|nr:nucleoporin Nup43 [Drosophila innubila]